MIRSRWRFIGRRRDRAAAEIVQDEKPDRRGKVFVAVAVSFTGSDDVMSRSPEISFKNAFFAADA
jgi:hypothetical protein